MRTMAKYSSFWLMKRGKMNLILKRVAVQKDPRRREAIDLFLHQHQLSLEADCEIVIVAEYQRQIVGCGADGVADIDDAEQTH